MKSIAIIGIGNIGSSISRILLANFDVIKIDKNDSLEMLKGSEAIIIAVKPQDFQELSEQLCKFIKNQTIISVMAGITLEAISQKLKTENVVRAMPNLAIAQSASLTGAFSGNDASKELAQEIIDLWGKTIWLDAEKQFDIFTALAGCGPAYFYKLAANLEKIAAQSGFSKKQAQKIANQTFIGAASVLNNDKSASELLKKVCSRGGVTEEAIKILDNNVFDQIIEKAVSAAKQKSERLSQ